MPLNSNSAEDIEDRAAHLEPLLAYACHFADLGSTGCEFRGLTVHSEVIYCDIDFDCETAEFDDAHKALIDDLVVIIRRLTGSKVQVVARSCPKYFGDYDV